MKSTIKALGLGLGAAMVFISPLMAMPQFCPNAQPGCAGTCHGDENLAKCPQAKGVNLAPELLKGLNAPQSLEK